MFGSGDSYKRIVRFFPNIDGKNLYVFTINNISFTSGFDPGLEYNYEFGLETKNGDKVRILLEITEGSVVNSTISIIVDMYTHLLTTSVTETILQTDFNIDKIDGTGPSNTNPSGYNYFHEWASQKFFILSDNNLHYTFGLINGKNLIPIHSFSQDNIRGDFLNGSRFAAHRPYFFSERMDSITAGFNPQFDFGGFSVYSDMLPCYKTHHVISTFRSFAASISAEVPLIAIQLRGNGDKYRGNIELLNLNIVASRRSRIFFYYGIDGEIMLTGSSFVNFVGNVSYDISSTSWTGGKQIHSAQIRNNRPNLINLKNIIGYQKFGYSEDMLTPNIVLITIDKLAGGGVNNVYVDIPFAQF